jgi:hypothetical protein
MTSTTMSAMPSIARLQLAEHEMRRLLTQQGLPLPDDVEYREDEQELVLFWNESRLAVIIECGHPPSRRSLGRGGFEPSPYESARDAVDLAELDELHGRDPGE